MWRRGNTVCPLGLLRAATALAKRREAATPAEHV
jgi:hypothetical protein